MSFKKSLKRLKKAALKNKKLLIGAAVIGASIYAGPAIASKAGSFAKTASKYTSKIKSNYRASAGSNGGPGVPKIATQMYRTISHPQTGRAADAPITLGNQSALMYGAESVGDTQGPARTVAAGAMMASPMACAATGGTPEFVISAAIVGALMIVTILLYKKLTTKKASNRERIVGFTR